MLKRLLLLALLSSLLWGTLLAASFMVTLLSAGWGPAASGFMRLSWTNHGCVFLALVAWPLVAAGAWQLRPAPPPGG